MTAHETIRVGRAPGGYDVLVGAGLVERIGTWLDGLLHRKRLVVITDAHIEKIAGDKLKSGLEQAGIAWECLHVPSGEAAKSFSVLEDVCDRLLDARVERHDMIAAFGGGAVGDVAGFAAGILRRGVDYIQIPTTLLAQVDSSIGGKTGIDTRQGKNLLGLFHPPRLVVCDTDNLKTLPDRHLRAGYAEIVKYALLGDAAMFDWLDENLDAILAGTGDARTQAIIMSVRAKADIVVRDERESGVRALLNLGHSFAHVLETHAGHSDTLLHGEAVALGLVLAFDLSARMGLSKPEETARVAAHLARAGLPTRLDALAKRPDPKHFMTLMQQDKKTRDGKLTFILARGIGQAFASRDVAPADLRALLETAPQTENVAL